MQLRCTAAPRLSDVFPTASKAQRWLDRHPDADAYGEPVVTEVDCSEELRAKVNELKEQIRRIECELDGSQG